MLNFRYLGRQGYIRALYEALSGERKALHPVQLSKETGMDMFAVQRQMEGCPELFVKLPRNTEGLVRWRLTSTASTMTPEQVEQVINDRARVEQLTLSAYVIVLVSFALVVLLTVVPATSIGLG